MKNARFSFALLLSVVSTICALPANLTLHPFSKDICIRSNSKPTSHSLSRIYALSNHFDDLDIIFCNPGVPIPQDEADSALTSALGEILPNLRGRRNQPIPGGSFQTSAIFKPSRNRITTFVHAVGDHDITWLQLAHTLTDVKRYMDGADAGPREYRSREIEFHVRYEDAEIALGRIQFVPGRVTIEQE